MDPIDYSQRTDYRPPPKFYSRMQWLGVLLTSLGLAPADAVTLEVVGRRSGKKRRTAVVRVEHDGAAYTVALAGESQWVRNVRAADGAAVIRRRGSQRVRLVELPVADRPPIIKAYINRGGKFRAKEAKFYFGLDAAPAMEQIRDIAAHYPVFRIERAP